VTTPDAAAVQRWRRSRPVCVLLDIADRALRADTADACEDAGIAVTAADAQAGEADVILIDRPVATAIPAIALVQDGTERTWPANWSANVCAVAPADTDAETLAAIITVVAAGYVLTPRGKGQDADSEDADSEGAGEEAREDAGSWTGLGDADEPGRTLSSREREVLALVAGGASNKEIAIALDLSISTVKFHVAAITEKLGARSRVDAVAIAVRAGMVMV
jgi:DNA-binding NarL/FixJ family response regulator